MNFMASECGSGCESGWTLYFDQSFVSRLDPTLSVRRNAKQKRSKVVEVVSDEEEEDLSMVSDASSGPPHFQEDESLYGERKYPHYPVSEAAAFVQSSGKRHRNKEKHQRHRRQDEETLSSFLDDTASSPLINFTSQNNVSFENKQASMESVLDYSQGFSATEFEQGRPLYQNHYDFFQSSSLSGNQMQRNQWY